MAVFLNREDIIWILKTVRTSCNLHGSDLEQAVITIQKLQEIANNNSEPNKENDSERSN